ncbi:MAG: PAS domain-containing sensor histidine kinase [Burkholderiaceae bacterium]
MPSDPKILVQRWGLALQTAAFGVWDLDVPAGEVHYSPEWRSMLGYGDAAEPDAIAVWRARVHPDDLQPMVDALNAHIDGRSESYEKEFRLRAADGRYLWVLSRGRLVERDAAGRPLRMVGTLIDLTDRREAESIRSERDRAEAASRAKTQFLSRMSHELRTPLNAVLGFAQLLHGRLGSADLEAQRRYVREIEKAGWHLLTLIDDVLDLARGESGQLELKAEPVPLLPLLLSAIAAAKSGAAARSIALRLEASATDEPTVLADAERLRQVIDRLLANAVKFNRDGGSVQVDVTTAGANWQVSITDTGIGIAASQLPFVFEPFNREGHANTAADGVGVGLMLSRWLVETMGGRLTARSVQGAGATFTIELPSSS